jgi:uncharacterized protein (DUF58 family)
MAAVLPFAVVAGPVPELGPLWILLLGIVGILVVADLVLSLKGVIFPVPTVPATVRGAKDREIAVPVMFSIPHGAALRLRFAVALPPKCETSQRERWIKLPANAARARIDWICTPRCRGRHAIGPACLEVTSRLGFWRMRMRFPLGAELRVYPNLFAERNQLGALFLNRGQAGTKLQRTVGRGREFEKLRDYVPGDGFDEIHWKATAKRGRPITKVFQAERTQEVYVVIDASRLSARSVAMGGAPSSALERYLAAALVLLLAAARQGDRFGLVVYAERVLTFIRAGNGAAHYGACRESVHALQTSENSPDLGELCTFLRTRLRRRALLFFLTDLTDPVVAEDFVRYAPLLSRQHLVLANQLRPPGVAPLFEGSEVGTVDEIYEKLAGHLQWRETRELADRLHPLGITATLLENESLAAQLVTQYIRVKRRQLL